MATTTLTSKQIRDAHKLVRFGDGRHGCTCGTWKPRKSTYTVAKRKHDQHTKEASK